ncbi:MAG: GNAT family N-acetyltransferase [Sphingomonadales bacterium]|nr:GNAT family N-acetyltransferase [Sphingomonadales bacterium]
MNAAHPLDRPVWHTLTGPQAPLARGGGAAWRIEPGYGPFAAARDQGDAALAALGELVRAAAGAEVWLVETAAWTPPPGTRVARSAPLAQMVATMPAPLRADDPGEPLDAGDAAAMAALAQATEPGPWGPLTRTYGQFYGVRAGAALVAMAGERMRPAPGLAEVSGVCTDPAWRGRGLAAALIRRVMAGFVARGDTPFLHSYAGNVAAIRLYESLGFSVRREMVVTMLVAD